MKQVTNIAELLNAKNKKTVNPSEKVDPISIASKFPKDYKVFKYQAIVDKLNNIITMVYSLIPILIGDKFSGKKAIMYQLYKEHSKIYKNNSNIVVDIFTLDPSVFINKTMSYDTLFNTVYNKYKNKYGDKIFVLYLYIDYNDFITDSTIIKYPVLEDIYAAALQYNISIIAGSNSNFIDIISNSFSYNIIEINMPDYTIDDITDIIYQPLFSKYYSPYIVKLPHSTKRLIISKNIVNVILKLVDTHVSNIDLNPNSALMMIDYILNYFINYYILPDKATSIKQKHILEAIDLFLDKSSHAIDIKEVNNKLKQVIFNQDQAIDSLCDHYKYKTYGLNTDTKPLSFLFLGSSGVGKTEVSIKFAEFLGYSFMRIDMSEYSTSIDVKKFTGTAPGYVGYEDEPLIATHVKSNPKSVILLDEIEKAHFSIYHLLLQILDYGVLTINNGDKIIFTDCIIIMTSNAKIQYGNAVSSIGFNLKQQDVDCSDISIKNMPPEFLNRINAIIKFNSILSVIDKIIEKELKIINIKPTKKVIAYIKLKGISDKFGARFIRRNVYKEFGIPIINYCEQNDINYNDNIFTITLKDNKIVNISHSIKTDLNINPNDTLIEITKNKTIKEDDVDILLDLPKNAKHNIEETDLYDFD